MDADDRVLNEDPLWKELYDLFDTAQFVTTGYDALVFLKHHRPSLVVLDVMMPDMSGIEVLRSIRGSNSFGDVPVLMYSADNGHGRIAEALREGAQGYIIKGIIGWREFIAEVRRLSANDSPPPRPLGV